MPLPSGRGIPEEFLHTRIPKKCKRLADVDLLIAVVSRHSARENSIRYGHPSTLHLWWARRPVAACCAMLLALLLDPWMITVQPSRNGAKLGLPGLANVLSALSAKDSEEKCLLDAMLLTMPR